MSFSVEDELFIDEVRRLAAGSLTSSMLGLSLNLEVFPKLKGRRVSLEELSSLLGMPLFSARMLAQFLCREGLLVYEDGLLANAPPVERHLTEKTRHVRELHAILAMTIPVEVLKGRLFTPPPLFWYQLRESGAITDGSSLVAASSAQEKWIADFLGNNARRLDWGESLAAQYDFSKHWVLLDIGGASGGWCVGIRRINPHLRCIVFDLPVAREPAEKTIAQFEQGEHITFVEGSFFTDELPRGADVALLANVVHNWMPEEGLIILRKAFDALPPGGTLLVEEAFFHDDWKGPMEAVFEAFVMLGEEGRSGWQPTYGEMEDMMKQAGFTGFERLHDVVVGRKP